MSDSQYRFPLTREGGAQLAGVWTTEMQQEEHQLQLWQQFLTIIYPGERFAEQAVLEKQPSLEP